MRAFSELEKKIIRKIIEIDEAPNYLNVLGNILFSFSSDSHLPDYCYIHVMSKADVAIMVLSDARRNNDGIWLQNLSDEVSKLLLTTVKLFEYLEKNDLAFFVGDLDLKTLGDTCANCIYDRCDFLEEESRALIYKYTRKKIYISETLKILSINEFKSEEQIRYEAQLVSTKRQLLITQIALGFTFIGLVASILIPVFGVTAVNINNSELVVSAGKELAESFWKKADAMSSSHIESSEKINSSIKSLNESFDKLNLTINDKISKDIKEIQTRLHMLENKALSANGGEKEEHNKAN